MNPLASEARVILVRVGWGALAKGLGILSVMAGLFLFVPITHGGLAEFLDNSRWAVAWVVFAFTGLPFLMGVMVLLIMNAVRFEFAGVFIDRGVVVFNGPFPVRIPVADIVSVDVSGDAPSSLRVRLKDEHTRTVGGVLIGPPREACEKIREVLLTVHSSYMTSLPEDNA